MIIVSAKAKPLSGEVDDSFVLTLTRLTPLRSGRAARKVGRRPTGLYGKSPAGSVKRKKAFDIK
jgi:hypothetical protein